MPHDPHQVVGSIAGLEKPLFRANAVSGFRHQIGVGFEHAINEVKTRIHRSSFEFVFECAHSPRVSGYKMGALALSYAHSTQCAAAASCWVLYWSWRRTQAIGRSPAE